MAVISPSSGAVISPSPGVSEKEPLLHHRPGRYGASYAPALAEAFGMQPHLSMRKFPLMLASMMQAFIMQAQAMGFERLDQITDEVIVRLVPAPKTLLGAFGYSRT